MPRRILLSILALAATAATLQAADLPTRSRLGAIFAEPAPARAEVRRVEGYSAPLIGFDELPRPVWNRGNYNYGSPWSYYDSGPYYGGGTPSIIRLPYVCGLYGYCD